MIILVVASLCSGSLCCKIISATLEVFFACHLYKLVKKAHSYSFSGEKMTHS